MTPSPPCVRSGISRGVSVPPRPLFRGGDMRGGDMNNRKILKRVNGGYGTGAELLKALAFLALVVAGMVVALVFMAFT